MYSSTAANMEIKILEVKVSVSGKKNGTEFTREFATGEMEIGVGIELRKDEIWMKLKQKNYFYSNLNFNFQVKIFHQKKYKKVTLGVVYLSRRVCFFILSGTDFLLLPLHLLV